MGGSAEDATFLGRECVSVLRGVNQLVALFRRQVTHATDRLVDDLAAGGRQLPELLKYLARLLFLAGSHVLPDFHAVQYAFLLLRRETGKTLQLVLQSDLLLRGEPAEQGIAFEHSALLRGRHVFIATQPVSGVARLVQRRMRLRRALLRMRVFLTVLRMRLLRSGMGFSERRGQQHKRRQTARNNFPAQHALVPYPSHRIYN